MTLQLDRLDHFPGEIAGIGVREIRKVFPNPTLIHLQGEVDPPVFISTLLHGNETTSFSVLQRLRETLQAGPLRRSLLIFIGNVRASEAGQRHLDGEPDFNRIWAHGETAYHKLAEEVLAVARRAGVFASIDIHNNTGRNPVYGCINSLRPQDLHLAAAFAPIGVYYLNPPTTQSIAFSHLGPAITLECGQAGDADGLAAALRLIDHVTGLDELPATPPASGSLELFETVGRVVVDPAADFAFGPAAGAGLVFRSDLEDLNFTPVKTGSIWAEISGQRAGLKVVDEHGNDLTDEFFLRQRGTLKLRQTVVPAMITRDEDIIWSDCLCYLMKPLAWQQ